MSVRLRKDTGKWEARYYYKGKRRHVGSHYDTEKIAKVAERTHRLELEFLENLNLETYRVPVIDVHDHMPWRQNEERFFLARFLSPFGVRFAAWVRKRKVDEALAKETERKLLAMETEPIAVMFDKE